MNHIFPIVQITFFQSMLYNGLFYPHPTTEILHPVPHSNIAMPGIFNSPTVWKKGRIRNYSGPYFPAFRLNTDQNNSDYGYFLRSSPQQLNIKKIKKHKWKSYFISYHSDGIIELFNYKKNANLFNWLSLQNDHEMLIYGGTSVLSFPEKVTKIPKQRDQISFHW